MLLDDIFKNRYSVRTFTSEPVKTDDIIALIESARLAPSACNSQTWRFIAVTDRATIADITRHAMRSVISNAWLDQAPLVIVGCSQLDLAASRIGSAITGIDYFQIDLGIAMEHMVLKATELGLGTCWIGWFHEKKLKTLLDIPGSVKVSALLAVGYPKDKTPGRQRRRKSIGEIAFKEKWGKTME